LYSLHGIFNFLVSYVVNDWIQERGDDSIKYSKKLVNPGDAACQK
jgi:hypothetical protein